MDYLRKTYAELRNIRWPSQGEVTNFTILTIILSLLIAYYLGLFDWLFTNGLRALLG